MSSYTQATSGVQGNTQDFSDIYSGAGATGDSGTAGAGATGGGASGGGGGYGGGNSSSADSGGGGGGAGGCPDAGGGGGGQELYSSMWGKSAYNAHTTPTASKNYLGQPSDLGRGGQGQNLALAATNGYNGWFYIIRIQNAGAFDMGTIGDTVSRTIDCGLTTGTVNGLLEMGKIA